MAAKKKKVANAPAGKINKSLFIRGVLEKNKKASVKEVQAAWTDAGNKGELGVALIYQQRTKAGIKAKGRTGRPPGRPPAGAAPSSSANSFEAMEASLDKLLAQAETLGDRRLIDDLRNARRRASAKLI